MTSPGAKRILGVDPGLRRMGWGIIESQGTTLRFVAAGTIKAPVTGALSERLLFLHRALTQVVADHRPDQAAVEETFVNKDPRSTLKLGQARAVALLVPAEAGITVGEYAPNLVKKTVVGAGHADKKQIRMMIEVLLPRATFDSDDAADALAIAVTHAHHGGGMLGAA